MNILITGSAGFIGFSLAKQLLEQNNLVLGLDNLNNYYDVRLKETRLAKLKEYPNFSFIKANITDQTQINHIFQNNSFDTVVHLAAQAGVRYSLENPHAYIDSNLVGFCNILEGCRHAKTGHLVFASSSSVYGANGRQPFAEQDNVDHPITLYAATKKANELMAHSYANTFQLPCTGLRFFTVYGPWGRPDMALFKFTKNILADIPIDVYNHGNMIRDFTYIDDIVQGILHIMRKPAEKNQNWLATNPDPATSCAPYRIYNIGNNNPVLLEDFIIAIEDALGKKAIKNFLPLQVGDVPATCADVNALTKDFNFRPSTSIQTGINNFVEWYREFYQQ